jgi:hypothetical protein
MHMKDFMYSWQKKVVKQLMDLIKYFWNYTQNKNDYLNETQLQTGFTKLVSSSQSLPQTN